MNKGSILKAINNKFKQRKNKNLIEENKTMDISLNKSFGAMYFIKNKNNENTDYVNKSSRNKNNILNLSIGEKRNNCSYLETKVNLNKSINGTIPKLYLKSSIISTEEEKNSSLGMIYFNKYNNNILDEYKRLSLNSNMSQKIETTPRPRFNSFNSHNIYLKKNKNEFASRTYSSEINGNKKINNIKEYKFKTNNDYINPGKKVINNGNYKPIGNKNYNELSYNPKTLNTKIIRKIRENEIKNEEDGEWERYKRKTTFEINRLKKNYFTNKISDINSKVPTNLLKSSKALSVAGQDEEGIKKINQDSYILEKNINDVLNFNIFGVLDGHGINGHLVSQFVSRYIINKIKNHPLLKNLKNPKEIYNKLKLNGYEIIAKIFTEADIHLSKQSFNCENSGTTCVIAIQLEEHIICANAGDSRAIMIFDEENSKNLTNTKIYPLSFDCKPENEHEKKRIQEHGGIVEQIIDENGIGEGPFRVWAKGEDYPGLAVSRSIGDFEAKKIGVIPNPQIIEYNINFKSKYMIICSDGIWEFINNKQAMEIGNKYYLRNDPNGLCNELTKTSTEMWTKEDIVIDDITVVVAFF